MTPEQRETLRRLDWAAPEAAARRPDGTLVVQNFYNLTLRAAGLVRFVHDYLTIAPDGKVGHDTVYSYDRRRFV